MNTNSLTRKLLLTLSAAAALVAMPAAALDLSWSGYATFGYARANLPGRYLRWIDKDGSFNAESVLAGQLDLSLNPQWSATLQLKAAPSETSDSRWTVRPSWAFVGWRPNDAWLVRAGRLRVPLYLHSEALDIGVAHDMARLPVEMYSISPTNDFNGVFVTHSQASNWLDQGELSLEAYSGRTVPVARLWFRDGAPPALAAGANFLKVNVQVVGALATLRSPSTTLRLGLHDARTWQIDDSGTPVKLPFVQIAPGLGYYRVNDALPGPPIPAVGRLRNTFVNLGLEHRFAVGHTGNWRVVAEYARDKQLRTELGSNTRGGYVALFKEIDALTPYVSVGTLSTAATQMDVYRRLLGTQLPAFIPGAAQINAAQRVAAESVYASNQSTYALGAAWRTPMGGKLKLEWARTRVGEVSRLVDTPAGAPSLKDARFDTWTVNYSLSF
jgi:hypothetical protein